MDTISGYEVKELFDPVQTHAAYSVPAETVNELKLTLKTFGATRFRVVKSGIKGLKIVCFKLPPGK